MLNYNSKPSSHDNIDRMNISLEKWITLCMLNQYV